MARSVLGIDAAWTITQPSGVALVAETTTGWQLLRVSSSYSSFASSATPTAHHALDAAALLAVARDLAGGTVTLITADLPLSREPILCRRVSDNIVSVAYGARHAGTHSPGPIRPGRISEGFREAFASGGYDLRSNGDVAGGLIEVYPHPALIELAGASRRLPYKIGRIGSYWPELPSPERLRRLLAVWSELLDLLEAQIAGVASALRLPILPASRSTLKAFEDGLDAVICAWVGICALESRAIPYGDATSAIWIPAPRWRTGESA